MKPILANITIQINPETGCYETIGPKTKDGYHPICRYIDGKARTLYAHRVAYEQAHGPIPEGLIVLHKCDNPSCINPDHLRVGTYKDNMEDMILKGRKKTKYKLSPEQYREIYVSTTQLEETAKKFGIKISHVASIRRRETAALFTKGLQRGETLPANTLTKQEVIWAFTDRCSARKAADQLGVPINTIRGIRQRSTRADVTKDLVADERRIRGGKFTKNIKLLKQVFKAKGKPKDIAKRFGCSVTTVYNIKRRLEGFAKIDY